MAISCSQILIFSSPSNFKQVMAPFASVPIVVRLGLRLFGKCLMLFGFNFKQARSVEHVRLCCMMVDFNDILSDLNYWFT